MMATSHLITAWQGFPWIAETVALSKQLLIVEETGVSAHFGQLTTKSSIDLIRWAKQRGLPVTCDVAMHQLPFNR